MSKTIYVLSDICTSCGLDTIDQDDICWVCKSKITPCDECDNQNTPRCLMCKNWRNMKYDTANAGRN